jgi:hypothetical protein
VPKWIKFIIAVLLLPVCAGAARALWLVLRAGYGADTVWIPLLAGAACWLVIFFLLPKPMWIYVFGHELTHALWTWLFGGQVKKMKVTSSGGHVVISKTNFLITLAPYFFPIYSAIVIGVFALGNLIWNWHGQLVWFHLCVGAAYAFHVTLTLHTLRTQQSDITSQGWLFSAVVIFLGNVCVLLLIRVHLCETLQVVKALINTGFLERDGRPLSAELSVWRRIESQFATICHYPAETRPLHFNVSRRFWCMIQTHAHETKYTLFRRGGMYYSCKTAPPASKPACAPRTKTEALSLINARNEAHRQPV